MGVLLPVSVNDEAVFVDALGERDSNLPGAVWGLSQRGLMRVPGVEVAGDEDGAGFGEGDDE